jgi:GTP-binding protein Era
MVGEKISIISPIPQTTRHQIKGILTTKEYQMVFVDTPGIHTFKDELSSHLNGVAVNSLEGCDLIIYVADVTRKIGAEEKKVADVIKGSETHVIVAFNKMDKKQNYLKQHIEFWEENKKQNKCKIDYLPISAKEDKNIEDLICLIKEKLPEGMPFYDEETNTDFPLKFRIADQIREQLFLNLKKDLPHSIAVEIDEFEDGDKLCRITVAIYVNRESQKKIVVGEKGEVLKRVGITARENIEKILNKKVFLKTWVKVLPDWQKKAGILKQLGY